MPNPYQIALTLPSEFTFIQRGWLNCNSIIIQAGGPPALIDSGHIRYVDETLELIRQAGVEPETIAQIGTTHSHCDHHGAVSYTHLTLPTIPLV